MNLGRSARTHVSKHLERDHEAPGELRAAAALGGEWTRDLVSMAEEDALPVGVGCRLRDADKAENDRDMRREERDQRTEVGKQRGDANVPEEVFLVLGKDARATALTLPWKSALGGGSTPWTTKPGGGSP